MLERKTLLAGGLLGLSIVSGPAAPVSAQVPATGVPRPTPSAPALNPVATPPTARPAATPPAARLVRGVGLAPAQVHGQARAAVPAFRPQAQSAPADPAARKTSGDDVATRKARVNAARRNLALLDAKIARVVGPIEAGQGGQDEPQPVPTAPSAGPMAGATPAPDPARPQPRMREPGLIQAAATTTARPSATASGLPRVASAPAAAPAPAATPSRGGLPALPQSSQIRPAQAGAGRPLPTASTGRPQG